MTFYVFINATLGQIFILHYKNVTDMAHRDLIRIIQAVL